MAYQRDAPTLPARWSTPPTAPRLPSEDVVVSAPMSYAGASQRIMRLRRCAHDERELSVLTAAALALTLVAWLIITVWYLTWGPLLVPYRIVRRRARQGRVQTLRHRELLESVHAPERAAPAPPPVDRSRERVGDADRERVATRLREHLLAGRLTTEEFEERLAATHRARTRGDLTAAQADLPRSSPAV